MIYLVSCEQSLFTMVTYWAFPEKVRNPPPPVEVIGYPSGGGGGGGALNNIGGCQGGEGDR